MREIGGYLELDNFVHKEYYQDVISLNTARNALVYLVRAKHISKVYLPYYLCDSVSNVCDRERIDYEFYHIDQHFLPTFDKTLDKNEYLYIVNFFGQVSGGKIEEYKNKYNNIIVDNVQAFFEAPINDVDTIYSCRKFFGVPDGAYLSSEAKQIELPIDKSKDRMRHILGRFEGNTASDYYLDFQANDSSFEDLKPMYMSRLTHNLLGAIDYTKIITKRNENWKILHDALNKKNKLVLHVSNAPYMYPFYCENGLTARKILAMKNIYIPTLWPNVLNFDKCELEKDYVKNILPLPCDQRYSREDMQRVIKEVLEVNSYV